MARTKKIRVAVIGAGNMGRYHLRNYAQLPGAQLVGLADIEPKAKKLADELKVKYYKGYQTMVDELRPEAVSIAVPTSMHLAVASYCLSKGVHCLVEKPIGLSVKEADELIGLAEKNGLILTVGHIERYNPLIQKIKQLIAGKELGKILSVVCIRVGGFPNLEPKTDVIVDLAVHDIDVINYLLGRHPDKIASHGSRTHHSREIDSAEMLLDYGNASGIIQVNWVTPIKIRKISITGSNGYLSGNYITQELELYKHNMQNLGNSFSTFVTTLGKPEKTIIDVNFQEPLAIELKTFLSAIRSGKDDELVSPWDAREALRLAQDAIKGIK